MKKTDQIIIMIIFVAIIMLSIFIANFFKNMESSKIDDCKLIEDNTSEEYFECLQQNDLDTWDMNNSKLYLLITWWKTFISISIIISAVVFTLFVLSE